MDISHSHCSHLNLSLETSCDETAVSLIRSDWTHGHLTGITVLAHVVESQIKIHQAFGGVVPEVAARDHLAKIHKTVLTALDMGQISVSDIQSCAVTLGPGLIGALMVGVMYARGFALAKGIPLYGVNHVDAHISPALLLPSFDPAQDIGRHFALPELYMPYLFLTVSGGHCHIGRLFARDKQQILGKSRDDACGEVFDKTSKLLGLGYPGGPAIEAIAKQGVPGHFELPRTVGNSMGPFDFSFSGLKTAVLQTVRKEMGFPKGKVSGHDLPFSYKANLAYSFQEAAINQLLCRLQNALHAYPDTQAIYIAGGVAANYYFRSQAQRLSVPVFFAPMSLCSDNATMIGLQALRFYEDGFAHHPFSRYKKWLQ